MDKYDADQVAELADALQSVDLAENHLADLRRLYETSTGFPFTVDKKNAPQAETIGSCRKVGSNIKKALGITSALPYGMSLVGYCDHGTSSWKMRPTFRAAVESLGWFSSSNNKKESDVQVTVPTDSFELWLLDQGNSTKTASNYAGAIAGRLSTLAGRIAKPNFAISQIDSASSFDAFCDVHDSSGEVKALNVRGKDMYRRALVWYAKYVTRQVVPSSIQDIEEHLRKKVNKSLGDTPSARAKRLAKADRIPKSITVTSVVYDRNPDVVAQVLYMAKGSCQGCGNKAPFIRRSDNTPYLEVHHRNPLANGGEDTVSNAIAVCPNCHRKMHYGV